MKWCLIALLLLLSAVILSDNALHAQIYNCNGKWTNQACDDSTDEVPLPNLSRMGSSGTASQELTPPQSISTKNTRLRMAGEPFWTFDNAGKSVQLKAAKVIIKNSGRVAAQDISVIVETIQGGGPRLHLAGPTALEPGQEGSYSMKLADEDVTYLKKSAKLSVRITCSNCWK